MTAPIELRILSAAGTLLETRSEYVSLPAVNGSVGILQHHAPMLVSLTAGMVTYRDAEGKTQTFPVPGGIAEIADDRIIILSK